MLLLLFCCCFPGSSTKDFKNACSLVFLRQQFGQLSRVETAPKCLHLIHVLTDQLMIQIFWTDLWFTLYMQDVRFF